MSGAVEEGSAGGCGQGAGGVWLSLFEDAGQSALVRRCSSQSPGQGAHQAESWWWLAVLVLPQSGGSARLGQAGAAGARGLVRVLADQLVSRWPKAIHGTERKQCSTTRGK